MVTTAEFARRAREAQAQHDPVSSAYAAALARVLAKHQRRVSGRLDALRRSAVADVSVVAGRPPTRDTAPPAPRIRSEDLILGGLADDLAEEMAPEIDRQTNRIGLILLGADWEANPGAVHVAAAQARRLAYVGDAIRGRFDVSLRDAAGGTFEALSEKVADLWDGVRSWYSDRVAGDEASTTIEGTIDSAGRWGAIEGAQRRWMTMDDAVVRPEHSEAHGQVVGIDEQFDVGGEALWFPQDPAGSVWNTISCRCWVEILDATGTPISADEAVDDEAAAMDMAGNDGGTL